jgi:DNA polymerase-1
MSLAWRDGQDIHGCFIVPVEPGKLFQAEGRALSWASLHQLLSAHPIVMHNSSFDYRVLFHHAGIRPPWRLHDTYYLAKLVGPQESLSLEALVTKYVEQPPQWWIDMKAQRGNMSKIPEQTQWAYGRQDAIYTLRLFEKLTDFYARQNQSASRYSRDVDFTRLVMGMIEKGVPIDQELARKRMTDFRVRMAKIVGELMPTKINNPNSVQQVSKWVANNLPGAASLPLTKGGKISVGEAALELFVDDPVVKLIIEYRQLDKGISSWLEPLMEMAKFDGKIHAMLDPFGTRSYRMSCDDINMQAVPMKQKSNAFGPRAFGAFHGIFRSDDPDEQLWAVDVKQAEFRMAAMLAKENGLAEIFHQGGDPYVIMAEKTWGDKTRRDDAKRAALSSIYEIGVASYAIKYKVSEKQAYSVLNGFRKSFPAIKNASNFYMDQVVKDKYVSIIDGRRRFFTQWEEAYKAFNQRVQGSVASAMEVTMLEFERIHPGRQVLQIHDSIELYLPRNEQARAPLVRDLQEAAAASIPQWAYQMTTPTIPWLLDVECWE